MSGGTVHEDVDFMERRNQARQKLDDLTGAKGGDAEDRQTWFNEVYVRAGGDPAAIPWADLAPKAALVGWLKKHPGTGKKAIDIACGLGDNAEALAEAGYSTTAFDLSAEAVEWARRRFPKTLVSYKAADLFDLPQEWTGAFDLVHESYTVQALDGELRDAAFGAIASLIAPGGRLLFLNRVREDGTSANGPPWPVMPSEWAAFEELGLTLETESYFAIERPGRRIPHVLAVFRRGA
ncbi:class I SAM-dependent methyltransferase [Roseibium sediminis]|uniref:class I SAM-dependent methyltransferase n=1 Tax=Roseibium sediminis TaxID=1775174 RepID=UPI001AD94EC7|nr:class I SAM-dependent methyltransferase [Roseibium sediminis]